MQTLQVNSEMWETRLDNSYIQYSVESGEIVIDSLFVSPSERGQKLGYKLIDKALEKAQELELTLALYAEPEEDGGINKEELIQYYRDYGFTSHGDENAMMSY